uniref:Uncharacterized protein n=1 Tax=Haptolina ericina TaxID=156174 RepID=A0A7S3B6Y8_9EUKA
MAGYCDETIISRGLGNTITWAWDARLCDQLLGKMEEDFWDISFVGCDDVRAALHRAFATWSMNHKFIKFTDVTLECAKRGFVQEGCPLAEVWVTYLDSHLVNGSTPFYGRPELVNGVVHRDVAQAEPWADYSSTFEPTNGGPTPFTMYGIYPVPRKVIEVTGGRISFNTESPTCWYLDSSFCQGWHDLKNEHSPDGVYIFSVTLLFFFWGAAFFATTLHFLLLLRGVLRQNRKLMTNYKPFYQRAGHALLLTCERLGFYRMTARLLLIMLPWAFYNSIFITCWDCYDFEAMAAHQIGHLLGLGHPNTAASELTSGTGPPGQNSYHTLLAAGGPMNASTCMNPWDYVVEGVPPGAKINPLTGNRYSIMDAVDLHNPRTCLTEDDLEALNVLYPTCSGAITQPTCLKQSIKYLGWLRVCVFVLAPLILAIAGSCMVLVPRAGYVYREQRKRAGAHARARRAQVAVQSIPMTNSGGATETIIVPPPEPTSEETTETIIVAPPDPMDGPFSEKISMAAQDVSPDHQDV